MRKGNFSVRPSYFELATPSEHPLAQGLVFAGLGRHTGSQHYHDSSLWGNHGTLTNMEPAPDWVSELGRMALDFDGSNDHVPTTNVQFVAEGPFTLSMWVNRLGNGTPLYSNYCAVCASLNWSASDNFGIWSYQTGSKWYVQVDGNGTPVSSTLGSFTNGVWTHLVLLQRNSSPFVEVYQNGISVYTSTDNPGTKVARGLILGRYDSDSGYFNGRICDVMVHNRVLSVSEISALANPGNVMLSLGGSDPGLLRYRRQLWGGIVIVGGISQAIGQVSETDSQSALSKAKEKAVALQTETDSCLAATTAKSVAVGLQEETDSSSALTSAKAAAIAIQSETDEALPLGAAISLAIGQVSETDEVFSISAAKEKAIGLVSETDSLFSLSAGLQANISQVSETDSALAVTSAKTKAIGLQSETNEAFSPSPSKAYTIGQASETDSLFALAAKLKAKSIGLVASVELSLPFATGLLSKGVEFRAPDTRLHFRAPDTRLHFLA